jgi:transposase-like protein
MGKMRERRKFTSEFKESTIALFHSSNKTAKEIAEELGLERSCVSRWLRESKEAEGHNTRAFPGQGNPRDEELARLRKEVADLRESNEILKKASVPKVQAIFTARKPR